MGKKKSDFDAFSLEFRMFWSSFHRFTQFFRFTFGFGNCGIYLFVFRLNRGTEFGALFICSVSLLVIATQSTWDYRGASCMQLRSSESFLCAFFYLIGNIQFRVFFHFGDFL